MKKLLPLSVLSFTLLSANQSFDNSKFIPDISLIMDGSYVHRSIKDDEAKHLELPSIAHGLIGSHKHGGHEHATYNQEKGFNLNYAELVLSSSVDPLLNLDGVFHFSQNGVEIEELYFTSNVLGDGFKLKGGKFLSNFGYLNEQHHHSWNFGAMPLVYHGFLGDHGINEKGLQLQYTLPTPIYTMIGVEALQGENEGSFGHEGIEEMGVSKKDGATMFVGYIKSSYDIGDTTLFGGISYASGKSRHDHSDDDENPHAFAGDAKLYGADFVLFHQLNSYSYIKWQSEYLQRELKGQSYNFTSKKFADVTKKQGGFYSELIYAYDKNYRTGIRYDGITKNSVLKNGKNSPQPSGLNRYTAMVEYNTSEFARFRLEYSHDRSMFDENDKRKKINTIMLQANISIGAHAPHSF